MVFPVDGISANHTDEVAPADTAAVTADENAPNEDDSEAGDDDSEDDDDIQVTIGDIKTTYESVLMLLTVIQFMCSGRCNAFLSLPV